ncbi:hypothetical protein Mal15_02060 [Stieleria maiorica]|uniref:ATP-grasp domain-containing protein n=1 Tax=Stieleria maiorica TaxID=2795974 RepID=A0A5B9M5T7_9BACT|nr:hypothetical protein [Stieleria maiorica]QEF96179.1 hypothetical protein Mal15_02060 [Stieleria maiorica]
MNARNIDLVIVGGESDPNTQRIVDQAHLRGVDYFFWDTDRPAARQIAWDFESPEIDFGDVALRPAGMFLRFNVFDSDEVRNHAAYDVAESFALAWPQIRLLNRSTTGDGNNKSRNLVRARGCGMVIPQTTVLGELSPLHNVPDPDAKIIKPLSGGDHAYIAAGVIEDPARLAGLAPQFVQERLEGENLRVFSIGGKLHAFHLQTTQVDYRTDDDVVVRAIEVPQGIVASIHRLVGQIGFNYCALDFRCRKGFDDPVFLEINSFPMFVAFDDACENRLADAILEFLV